MNTQTTPDAETTADLELRNQIANALSAAGAYCGDCSFEPGDRGTCTACERHWTWCADKLLPLFEAQRSVTLTQAAGLLETLGMDDASAQLRYQATPYTDDTAAAEGVR